MPLSVLAPADRNPKRHELERIKASIRDHGFVEAPIADERTGRIIAGHGRRESLIEMFADGEPMPDGLLMDEDAGWLIPVSRGWASQNDREAEALIINLNRLTEAGGWNERMLARMLEDLATQAPDLLDSLCYSDDEMDNLLRSAPAETLGELPGMQPLPSPDLDDDERVPGGNSELRACPACGHIL
jgi:hypothetical protein